MLSSELGSRVPNCVFSNRVIEEELKDVPSEDVPPLTPLAVEGKTEQEEKLVKQLSKMIRIVGDRVQLLTLWLFCCSVIDGVASGSGSKSENFRRVADKVFEDGITWERIAVLIYVAGRLAVKVSCDFIVILASLVGMGTENQFSTEAVPGSSDPFNRASELTSRPCLSILLMSSTVS
uniref:Bcl-2 Bcl-2 homology region 1-3 domain-containing protein n=1 Tax=Haplochromis burtoni TaxID=8153 RepID=A0A3Q2WRH9_HAPBU